MQQLQLTLRCKCSELSSWKLLPSANHTKSKFIVIPQSEQLQCTGGPLYRELLLRVLPGGLPALHKDKYKYNCEYKYKSKCEYKYKYNHNYKYNYNVQEGVQTPDIGDVSCRVADPWKKTNTNANTNTNTITTLESCTETWCWGCLLEVCQPQIASSLCHTKMPPSLPHTTNTQMRNSEWRLCDTWWRNIFA